LADQSGTRNGRKYHTSRLYIFIPSPDPSPPGMTLPTVDLLGLGQTRPLSFMYCRWTILLNNAPTVLDALGELQLRSREANGRSHTNFLSPIPSSKKDTRVWQLSMMQR